MIKRALISVWDKKGVVELAEFLTRNDIEIISTGGTKKVLEENNIKVTSISEITGIDSIMDGRVKTLNPQIFGSILADRGNSNHLEDLDMLGGSQIDIVVVNFYPFEENAVKKNLNLEDSIEYIDIGGPSMLRAAAKNYKNVIPLCDYNLYQYFMNLFSKNNGIIPDKDRTFFAVKVFELTSDYETKIFNYFNKDNSNKILPYKLNINLYKKSELRYGENPHQEAAFYLRQKIDENLWNQHQGKALSYNNYNDLESAFNIVNEFSEPACVIIKHANPCGFGIGDDLNTAYNRAVSTDPVSYFGGIVGFNRTIDLALAQELIKPFLECIIAPKISSEALEIFKKKKNLRILTLDDSNVFDNLSIKSSAGGFVIQEKDTTNEEFNDFDIVTEKKVNENQKRAMKIGWKIVKYVKSNAIVIANEEQVLGIGAGQMSRIDSVKIAIRKIQEAGLPTDNAILASDAFFPFPDSVELASSNGITAIIQPGGSIKDEEVISKANELDIAMVMTGIRHFYH